MAAPTPPLRTTPIVEPSAPRHGSKHDTNEPHLRRRSSRLKTHRTPSPNGFDKVHNNQSTRYNSHTHHHHLSPPSSPISPNAASPRRRQKRDMRPTVQESGLAPIPIDRMLPTPVKTPSQKDTKRNTKTASRVLFPQGLRNDADDVVPHRSRVSLYSPGSVPAVEIYTDMNARVPELDESEENIFYDAPHKRTARTRTRAKQLEQTDNKRKDLEENRDPANGMWFTFRGKKVWREYVEDDQDEPVLDSAAVPVSQRRKATPPPRFRKTPYQPRTLFPEAHGKGDTTDEEAVTDIEHPELHETAHLDLTMKKPAATPVKQRFYATPPTTARTTRSTAKRPIDGASSDVDELSTALFSVKKGSRSSPFNEWSRVKGDGSSSSQERKRKADDHLGPENGKRVRSEISD